MSRWALIGGSLLAHGGLVLALGEIRTAAVLDATPIEVRETVKPEPPPPTPMEETPPPEPPQPKAVAQPAARPLAAEPPPEAAPAPMANLPDFGIDLSGGGASGGPGLAVPKAGPPPREDAKPVTKTLGPAAKASAAPKDTCEDPPAKPKLQNLPQPAYTEDARSAGIEGKVRVELTVDETGKVVSAQALTSLGHGLDEAALAAARGATFEPAIRCGKPSRSTFTIAIRFSAS